MSLIRSVFLYAALALGANAALAGPAELSALRSGDMKKMEFLATPRAVPDIAFVDAKGGEHRLADYRGKYVLVNFWATWCAPCRLEMPSLDRLQAAMGGARFQVVPIATIRNTVPAVQRFYKQAGVTQLPIRLDPHAALAHQMGVMGLPVTVVLDPQGREIARLIGGADWDSKDAHALLGAITGQGTTDQNSGQGTGQSAD